MSTAAGTNAESKQVAHPLASAVIDDAETKLNRGLEAEFDDTKQDAGFRFSLGGLLDKFKGNQNPNRWKEQILGKSDVSSVGSQGSWVPREIEMKILSISIQSPGCPDIVLPIHDPVSIHSRRNSLFSLNEGSICRTRLAFLVTHGTVHGLKHTYTVWKSGIRVVNAKILLGSFVSREEAYTHELPEETIPCGIFVRGSYFVRTKFVDESGRCYIDFSYSFEIRKK